MGPDGATGGGSAAARALLLSLALAGLAGCSPAGRPSPVEAPPASAAATLERPIDGEAVTLERPIDGEAVTLERLIDGDSMELVIAGEVVEVRLLGVNAPELRSLDGDASCNGRQARAAMAALVAGGELSFAAGEEDRFGRLLGVLFAGGRNLNEVMVADGWALGLWSADDGALVPLMREAAEAGRGLWGDTCGPPAAGLEVGEVLPDAPGRDEEHLDEEWVEVTNPTDRAVNLAGWSVADETTSNRFALPAIELGPGRTLRVVTGSGDDNGGGRFHLGRDVPVWNNRGETVLVVDPAGIVAAHRFVD